MCRRCVPSAAWDDSWTLMLPFILDQHDPAPLTEAFLRALSAAWEEAPARVDRTKAVRVL
jgi:hypothetical protein